jgi:hypothetical protein
VWTETGAEQPLPDGHPLVTEWESAEQAVLTNLLRLNQGRSGSDNRHGERIDSGGRKGHLKGRWWESPIQRT